MKERREMKLKSAESHDGVRRADDTMMPEEKKSTLSEMTAPGQLLLAGKKSRNAGPSGRI